MTAITTSTAKPQRDDVETEALRRCSGLICLWGLCDKRACRRARAYRGEPRDCLGRYARLVPEAVRDCAKAIVEAKWQGLSFEEFYAETDADFAAYCEWLGAMEASLGGRRGTRATQH